MQKYTVVCTVKDKGEAFGFLLGDNEEHLVKAGKYDIVNYVDAESMKDLVKEGKVSSFRYNEEKDCIEVEYGTTVAGMDDFLASDITIEKSIYNTIGSGCLAGTVMMVLNAPNIGNCVYLQLFGDMSIVKKLVQKWGSNKVFALLAQQAEVYDNNANLVIPLALWNETVGGLDMAIDLSVVNRKKFDFTKKLNRVYRKMEVKGDKLRNALKVIESHNRKVLVNYGIFNYKMDE